MKVSSFPLIPSLSKNSEPAETTVKCGYHKSGDTITGGSYHSYWSSLEPAGYHDNNDQQQ
jgi:hypothetical protein